MPQAQIIDLADSIVAELNVHAFSEPFRAERGYLPTFELSDLNVLQITVVPNQDDGRLDSRIASIHEYTVDVGVQIKPKDVASQYLDPYVYLTQEIADYFRFGKVPGGTSLVSPRTVHIVLAGSSPEVSTVHERNHADVQRLARGVMRLGAKSHA